MHEISLDKMALRFVWLRGDWHTKVSISSAAATVGATSPERDRSIKSKMHPIPEKSERRKVARKAVFPVQ